MDLACHKCGKVYSEIQKCPTCNIMLTRDWSGKAAILEPDKSRIAREMDIKLKGVYALKV